MAVDGASDSTTHNSTTKQALGRLVSKAKKSFTKIINFKSESHFSSSYKLNTQK